MDGMIRLSARSTPARPRTRSTAVSGKVWAKSTFGVSLEVTHTSALQFSIVTVALFRSPMKRPTCTRTRVTAKATPATVITKRRRSWNRFFRARETFGSILPGRREEARDAVLDAFVHQAGGGAAMGPVLGLHRDQQGHRAVDARPEPLGHGLRIPRAEAAPRDGRLDRQLQDPEGFLARAARLRDLLELGPGHEHESVVVRVLEAEAAVAAAELADPLDRVVGRELPLERGEQLREVVLAERVDEVVLVLEMVVDGGGGVLDRIRDPPHRDLLVAFGREQLTGRVEDLRPDLLTLPLASLGDAHRLPLAIRRPLPPICKLTTLRIR